MYRIVFYQSDKGWEFEDYPYTLIRALYCIKGLLDMLQLD